MANLFTKVIKKLSEKGVYYTKGELHIVEYPHGTMWVINRSTIKLYYDGKMVEEVRYNSPRLLKKYFFSSK